LHNQNLYGLGARRIGVTSLAHLGCLPTEIALFGKGKSSCVPREALKESCPDLKLVVFDIYIPLLDLVENRTKYGITASTVSGTYCDYTKTKLR
jgi:hypothetical protein